MNRTLVLLALVAVGASWDGRPPGNIQQLFTAESWTSGHAPFPAGTYVITKLTSYTAWGDDQIKVNNALVQSGVRFTTTAPWVITLDSRDLFVEPSTGPKFQWSDLGLGRDLHSWRFGAEDMAHGDEDFNDVIARVDECALREAVYVCGNGK